MKKFQISFLLITLISVVFIFTAISICSCKGLCKKYYETYVAYEIVYPDSTVWVDTVFNCECFEKDFEDYSFKVYTSSFRGSNYIRVQPGAWNEFSNTTCPIRIIKSEMLNK